MIFQLESSITHSSSLNLHTKKFSIHQNLSIYHFNKNSSSSDQGILLHLRQSGTMYTATYLLNGVFTKLKNLIFTNFRRKTQKNRNIELLIRQFTYIICSKNIITRGSKKCIFFVFAYLLKIIAQVLFALCEHYLLAGHFDG